MEHESKTVIGRIPIMSANGELLMPCRTKKAWRLLESGEAVLKRSEDGTFYLKLKFNPQSPIVRPSVPREIEQYAHSDDEDTEVRNLVPPKREYVTNLVNLARRELGNRLINQILKWEDRMYLYLLFRVKREIKSSRVLEIVMPIVKRLLEALAAKSDDSACYDKITHEELVKAKKKGIRNGRYRKLKNGRCRELKKTSAPLLDAAIAVKRAIVNVNLKERLEKIIEFLEPPSGMVSKSRILRTGRKRAMEMLSNLRRAGVLRWAPQFLDWLNSKSGWETLGVMCVNQSIPLVGYS